MTPEEWTTNVVAWLSAMQAWNARLVELELDFIEADMREVGATIEVKSRCLSPDGGGEHEHQILEFYTDEVVATVPADSQCDVEASWRREWYEADVMPWDSVALQVHYLEVPQPPAGIDEEAWGELAELLEVPA